MTATFGRAFLAGIVLAALGAAYSCDALADAVVRLRARRQEPRRTCRPWCVCGAGS